MANGSARSSPFRMEDFFIPGLKEDGVVVLPYPGQLQAEEVSFLFPDIGLTEPPFVGGSFGGLGNPMSFHSDAVRHIRMELWASLQVKLHMTYATHEYVEQIPDRLLFRPKYTLCARESWHRDLSPIYNNEFVEAAPGDIILGGWVNLNNFDHCFKCVRHSHSEVPTTTRNTKGFSKIAKDMHEHYATLEESIIVPPGHFLLFDQRIVHRINAKREKDDIKRLHVAFRMTNSPKPLIRNIGTLLREGAVLPLKSGQIPPLVPKLWGVNYPMKWIEFSDRVQGREVMKEVRSFAGHKTMQVHGIPDDSEYIVVKRFMPSLQRLGVGFTPYSDQELEMYRANVQPSLQERLAKRQCVR